MTPSRIRTLLAICALLAIVVLAYEASIRWRFPAIMRKFMDAPVSALYRFTRGNPKQQPSPAGAETTSTPIADDMLRARLALLESENASLRVQLNFLAERPYRHIGAEAIAKSPEPGGSALIINRGAEDGISLGNAVLAEDGVLVGKVRRVNPGTAQVTLLNDPESNVAATIINEKRSMGLVQGGFGVSVRMNFIPQNEVVHVGDMIMTSGLEEGVPRGLLIGTVEAVEKEAYQPFQRAVLNPAIGLDRITVVSVLVSSL